MRYVPHMMKMTMSKQPQYKGIFFQDEGKTGIFFQNECKTGIFFQDKQGLFPKSNAKYGLKSSWERAARGGI